MTTLTLAILQTRKHQLLPAQALEAYLRIFGRQPDEPFDYATALGPPVPLQLQIAYDPNGVATARVRRTLGLDINFTVQSSHETKS